jgi:hypothetical protein
MSAKEPPMTFVLRGDGGNHDGAEWIAAEGVIQENSVSDLAGFARRTGSFTVRFSTPGGSLEGGLRLGEWIRDHKFSTEVGTTVPDKYGHSERAPGRCASAGAFAFIGGVARSVDADELGVHQFYYPIGWNNPSQKLYNARHLSSNQLQSALLIDFANRMGVDPRFVSTASSTLPQNMYYFTDVELDEFRIRWSPRRFMPWSLEPHDDGVVAVSRTQDGTRVGTFYCTPDGVPHLEVTVSDIPFDWYRDAIDAVDQVCGFGLTFPKSALSLRTKNGATALDYRLPGVDGVTIVNARWPGVGVEGPRYIWNGFQFEMPREKAIASVKVVLRNPISAAP